jgi:hypothetical protein
MKKDFCFCFADECYNFTVMKKSKKIKGAEAVGVKVKVSKLLDKLSGKVLFPDKLKAANKIISKVKISG